MYSNNAVLEKITKSSRTEAINVTELTWAVSGILNLLREQQKRLDIKKRGEVIATIVPAKIITDKQ
jgi:hypothetical protein